MHSRNLGSEQVVGTGYVPYVPPPFAVSRGEILHFKYPRVKAVRRIATRTFRDKKQQQKKPTLFFST